ncbi:MAG: response regulator [Rubrivivax sp.]|nr:MAG: response regulator [Rubrivivax sp.]
MKIVVVEDSLPVQQLLVQRLAGARLQVVGTAVGADEALELVLSCQPDVVLLDLKLSPGSGLWVLTQLRARGVQAKILIFSSEDRGAYANLCRIRGADGFFDKAHDLEELVAALEALARPAAAVVG